MVGEMVKKQGRARLYLSCNYFCTLDFLVKILLVNPLSANPTKWSNTLKQLRMKQALADELFECV